MAAAGYSSRARPVLCENAVPCQQVFLGGDHTILKGKDGALYTCGRGDSGQLGHGNMHHYFEPTRVQALDSDPIRLVEACGSRTVGVSTHDNFYIWGKAWGDGHGGVKSVRGTKSSTPSVVLALSKRCIVSVSLGEEHGAACNNIGTVYTFGSSNDHLQLGTATPWAQDTTAVPSSPGNAEPNAEPLAIEVNEATSVRAIACGGNHSVSVTSEDEGYTWGCNMKGQLGLGHKRPAQRPALLRAFKPKDAPKLISDIYAGGDFNAVFATMATGPKKGEGGLFMWGRNVYGQLGLGHTTEMSTPQHMFRLGNSIRLLTCGPNHVLACCDGKAVFAWGRGVHGQLGNGYVSKQTTPRLITNLKDLGSSEGEVVHLGAGENHSACVLSSGKVYVWGSDLYGQLGLGEGNSASTTTGDVEAQFSEGSLDESLSSPIKFGETDRTMGLSFGSVTKEHFTRSLKAVNTPAKKLKNPDLHRFTHRRQNPQEEKARAERRRKLKIQDSGVDQFIKGLAHRLGGPLSPLKSSSQLGPLDAAPLNVGDFTYHDRFARTTKKRRAKGKRVGTMKFIDDLLQARDDEIWIAEHPEEWMRMKQERGGPTPDPLEERKVFDGRIR